MPWLSRRCWVRRRIEKRLDHHVFSGQFEGGESDDLSIAEEHRILFGESIFRSSHRGLKPTSKRTIEQEEKSKARVRKRRHQDRDRLPQIFVEPGNGLIQSVGLVFGFKKKVAFARINNELGWDTERP